MGHGIWNPRNFHQSAVVKPRNSPELRHDGFVNLAQRTPATHRLVVRHRDRPGVLAQVLDAIKAEHINVQEMENIVFEGAEAAVARINLDKAPTQATLDRLRSSNEDIMELNVLEIS